MGLSLLATLISSVTFIAYPGSAYAGDWSNLVPGFMVVIVLALVGLLIIPFFRQAVGVSAYEYFGKRFGNGVRIYSSLAFSATLFSKAGFVFYLLALTVSGVTHWDTHYIIILIGAITTCYTLIGGMEAIIWADVLQGFVLWAGIFTCLGFLLFLPPGGPMEAFRLAWMNHKIRLGSMAPDLTRPTFLVLSLYGFFFYLKIYGRSDDRTTLPGRKIKYGCTAWNRTRGSALHSCLGVIHADRHTLLVVLPTNS